MPSDAATCSATATSRELIATTSQRSATCMAGMTFSRPIFAAERMPQRSRFDTSPRLERYGVNRRRHRSRQRRVEVGPRACAVALRIDLPEQRGGTEMVVGQADEWDRGGLEQSRGAIEGANPQA